MKTCQSCGIEKSLECFAFRSVEKKIYQSYCKECRKSIDKKVWHNKTTDQKQEKTTQVQKRRLESRLHIWEFLSSHPCVECGETDPVVLQFDHQHHKEFDISYGVSKGYGLETIKLEIAKCQIRCANCHMRKTANDFGWYKDFRK